MHSTVHFNSGALLWTDKGDSTTYCSGDGNLLCHSYFVSRVGCTQTVSTVRG